MPAPGDLYYTEAGELDREAVNLALKLQAGGLALFQLLETAMLREIVVGSPGAGVSPILTVPAGSTWELVTVKYQFVASAAVANRVPNLIVKDADATVAAIAFSARTFAANAAATETFMSGVGTSVANSGTVNVLPTPPLILLAGWTLTITAAGLDAGDTFLATIVVVREWAPGRVARTLRYLFADLDGSGGIL